MRRRSVCCGSGGSKRSADGIVGDGPTVPGAAQGALVRGSSTERRAEAPTRVEDHAKLEGGSMAHVRRLIAVSEGEKGLILAFSGSQDGVAKGIQISAAL